MSETGELMAERVWTIADILAWTADFFQLHGIESPRLDAEVLLAAVLGRDRMYLYVHFDEPLEPEELAQFRSHVKERAAHVPLAYVLGRREFMGLGFRVTRDTLIPRPDTEILVQCGVDFLRARREAGETACTIADIGTGTGAIALSTLRYTEGTRADAVDISSAAAAVARERVRRVRLRWRVANRPKRFFPVRPRCRNLRWRCPVRGWHTSSTGSGWCCRPAPMCRQ